MHTHMTHTLRTGTSNSCWVSHPNLCTKGGFNTGTVCFRLSALLRKSLLQIDCNKDLCSGVLPGCLWFSSCVCVCVCIYEQDHYPNLCSQQFLLWHCTLLWASNFVLPITTHKTLRSPKSGRQFVCLCVLLFIRFYQNNITYYILLLMITFLNF